MLQEDRRDGQGALDVAVSALDDGLVFVTVEHLDGVDVRVEVGQQGVPAVAGRVGVEGGLVEGPGEYGFALGCGGDGRGQVGGHPPMAGDGGGLGVHGFGGGVVAGTGGAGQGVEV